MGTITGILATLAVSHLGGSALAGLLVRLGAPGFIPKIKIARHILQVVKALRFAFEKDPSTDARTELLLWLKKHDPQNESKLGDGININREGRSSQREVT